MRHLRFLIIAVTAFSVLALGVFALANRPAQPAPADDDIIIKGGSLEIQCGKNHGKKCLGSNDNQGKYKNQDSNKHIFRVVVMPLNGNDNSAFFSQTFDNTNQPQIKLVYCEAGSTPGTCKGSDKPY